MERYIKSFGSFINENLNISEYDLQKNKNKIRQSRQFIKEEINTIKEKEALELAKNIMNVPNDYESLGGAIEDMYNALDYGVQNEKDIRNWLRKYEKYLNY